MSQVEDDGRGLGTGRHDSFGLSIMRERASRLRTNVEVAPREPRGTRVEVVLGGPTASATRLPDDSSQPHHTNSQQGLEELPST